MTWEPETGLTQKSRLYLRFLKRPPTMAARWMTWVGLCFSNRALVSAAFLERGKQRQRRVIVTPTPTNSRTMGGKTCVQFSRSLPKPSISG